MTASEKLIHKVWEKEKRKQDQMTMEKVMNGLTGKPKAYLIDGKRITQLKRAGLLKLLEQVHGDYVSAVEEWRFAEAQRDQAITELDERVRECDVYRRQLRESIELTGKTDTARIEMQVERDEALATVVARESRLREAVADNSDLSNDLSFVRAELAATRDQVIGARVAWGVFGGALVSAAWGLSLWLT